MIYALKKTKMKIEKLLYKKKYKHFIFLIIFIIIIYVFVEGTIIIFSCFIIASNPIFFCDVDNIDFTVNKYNVRDDGNIIAQHFIFNFFS